VCGRIKSIGSLHYVDIVTGKGKVARSGMHVTVEYTGWLLDGTKFDSSDKQPFEFDLGAGNVIQGWDIGVRGMRVGGKRRLIVPPELGYGQDATGPIPANSTLTFDVKLLAVK
jgi:peptidylprolyl isomerase